MPRFLSAQTDTKLITLPWSTPLAEWPAESLVALPRGGTWLLIATGGPNWGCFILTLPE